MYEVLKDIYTILWTIQRYFPLNKNSGRDNRYIIFAFKARKDPHNEHRLRVRWRGSVRQPSYERALSPKSSQAGIT